MAEVHYIVDCHVPVLSVSKEVIRVGILSIRAANVVPSGMPIQMLPLTPKAINIRVMQEEERVARRRRHISHFGEGSANCEMAGAVISLGFNSETALNTLVELKEVLSLKGPVNDALIDCIDGICRS